ncbi:hypothetical protein BCV69DRAFT_314861 [Microstroma glucosiphilum]|uniref:Uncharacterized protein n=1 Tax=Pseudomicrostroma glucosiphilum TaxID=1684307 RepID=A0A316U1M3_9BASI|nr:hypothetical protein BCV69DRAFT_314861 [Pseudomicrostroma glucosiphilum]PWN18343.1 hypothetical protein BCV69DRAFT_314861 [Pseudomicrostroma glucosiphilum]
MDATTAATTTAIATGSTGTGSTDNGQHDGEQQQQRDTCATTTSMNAPTKAMSAPTNTGDCSDPDAADTSLIVHPHAHPRSHSGNDNGNANANGNGERPHHHPHPHPQHQLTAHSNGASTGAGQVKFGIGSEDTSMLELFPVLGVSQGGRLKIDWETEKESGLAIRPEESLFDLVHKSSRFTELVLGGKSIAAALGLLHSGTRLLDSENAARRSMSPLESKMYEAWKNGATLPSLAGLIPLTTPGSTMHRDRLFNRLVPEEKQHALALGQLYKLPDGQGVSLEQLQAFERQYPQLLSLVSARCKVLSVDDDAGVLRSDRVAAECLALRKTISMMDGALNDIVAMIANAVQTVNETSELLRARLEGLTLGTAPCEVKDSYATHQDFTGSNYPHPRGRVEEHPEAEERTANDVYVNNGTCDERMNDDDDDHDGHHRTSETGHDHLEEDNVIEDDAMSEDQDGAAEPQIRSSSPTAQNCSSDALDEVVHSAGVVARNEAQSHPASEVSDTERVERLLSEPPEGSAQAQDIDVHHQDSSIGRPITTHGAPPEAIPVPRRPETGSVTGFMSLGKKPTLALLPEMADTSSSALRGPTGDAHSSPDDAAASEKAHKVVALGEGGGTSGKSLPFAPAGSSGRGSTPFVIAGRKD